jgi:hypothetical protein
MCNNTTNKIGIFPASVDWNIVRGDTSELRVDFLNNDETTPWDIEGWEYSSTAYDSVNDSLEELEVIIYDSYILIKINPDQTLNWGSGYSDIIARLPFDLKIRIPTESDSFIWTPISGTIVLCSDVSSGL